jgi:hypothetical protein
MERGSIQRIITAGAFLTIVSLVFSQCLFAGEATEQDIIDEIAKKGIGDRFTISEISPIADHPAGEHAFGFAGGASRIPGVENGMSLAGSGTILRFGGKTKISTEEWTPMPGVRIFLPKGIKGFEFEGESENQSLLSFVLIEKYGLVYLSGSGRVTFPNGRTVKLPQKPKKPISIPSKQGEKR